MRIVVVGGAGFIGSAVSRLLVGQEGATALVIDKLSPTSSLASLAPVQASARYSFRKADISDPNRITALLQAFSPDAIVHAAAECEACTALGGAQRAIDTSFTGTWRLMEAVRDYWSGLPENRRADFRFVSVSTADPIGEPDATRTAADDLVLAWHKAYGLPSIVARAATTFGPYQFPQATVPATIVATLGGRITETSGPARDWIYLDDLAAALATIVRKGTPGAAYTVTGRGRATPADLANRVARLVERHAPARIGHASLALIKQARATTGHDEDALPALDGSRLFADTGWKAAETLDSSLSATVRWYLANEAWWRPLEAASTTSDVYGILRIA